MKTSVLVRNCLALAFLLTMSGCKETYTVVTTLLPDGSCDRVITVTSDTARIPDVAFPLPIDSTWETTWTPPVQKGEKWLFTARKHFAHVDSMNQEYARLAGPEKIRISVSMERKFRWFYSYYSYREKYQSFNPFTRVPLSQFMSDDEVQRYLAGDKSDSLKKKREAWENRNMFEEFYLGLTDLARAKNEPSFSPSLIESKKEALFKEVMSSNSNDVVDETARTLGAPVVRKLSKEIKAIVDDVMRKTQVAGRADGEYTSTVVMPGTILDTNTKEIKGNSAAWRFSDEQLGIADVEMVVESRSVNLWPLLVTGLVVIGLIILPSLLRQRQRQEPVPEHV